MFIYANAHDQHVHSISLNRDGEDFLSACDFKINIWNMEKLGTVYNVIDFKKDEVSEIITYSEFHPKNQNIFLYTTSKGYIHICDFRDQATFFKNASLSFLIGMGQKKNVFSDMINTVS